MHSISLHYKYLYHIKLFEIKIRNQLAMLYGFDAHYFKTLFKIIAIVFTFLS